jgi:hypothetical protein
MYIFDDDKEAYTISPHCWPNNITTLYVDINKVKPKVTVSFHVSGSGAQNCKPLPSISLAIPSSWFLPWDESWVQRVRDEIKDKTVVPLKINQYVFEVKTERPLVFRQLGIGAKVPMGKKIICNAKPAFWGS